MEERTGAGTGTTSEVFLGGSGSCIGRFGLADQFFRVDIQASRQADFSLFSIDSQNSYFERFADLDNIFGIFDLVIGQFRNVQQALEIRFELDEHSEVGDLGDFSVNCASWCESFGDVGFPRIFLELFEPECDASSFFVDGEDLAGDCIALFQQFAGMSDFSSPGHVTDMEKAVNTLFQFDESTVIGEVPHGSFNRGPGRVLGRDVVPGVGSGLLHTQ